MSGALPGVSILTIQALTNVVNYPLRELCLIDLPIVSDAIAAKLFSSSHLSGLEVLKLRLVYTPLNTVSFGLTSLPCSEVDARK